MSQNRTWKRSIGVAVAGFAVILASGLIGAAPANAIANGSDVPDGQYPFSTKLTMHNIPRPNGTLDDSACSGALIAPQWIITAGHCFHDVAGNRVSGPVPYETTATVGRTDLTGTAGYVVAVTEVRQAPQGDVALARLASPIPGIAPLPVGTKAPRTGTIVRMTGFGATNSVNPVPVTRLQTGQFEVRRVSGTSILVQGYAPAPDTSACPYDSGAPYFLEAADGSVSLVSVESDGPGCPHAQLETTSRVDRISGWIATTTA
jgi:secreted trypsin-like serine protease